MDIVNIAEHQNTRARPIPQDWSYLVVLNTAYRVLICSNSRCRYALSPTAIARHLHDRHQAGIDIQRQVHQYVEAFPFTYDHATVLLPADGLPPQPIVPVVDRVACREYTFKSISRDMMRQHANKAHDQKRLADQDSFTAVRLQSWFGKRRERYWVVDESQQAAQEHQDINKESDCPLAPQEQDQAQERLGVPQPPGLQYMPDTTALYVQHANWPATFAELQHWHAMREMIYIPKTLAGVPSMLQLQLGNTVLGLATYEYTAETEGVLNYIMHHMPPVWIRCKTTFRRPQLPFVYI
jgi:hypothetical protein